jgi:Protein of unknown function (DUF3433)
MDNPRVYFLGIYGPVLITIVIRLLVHYLYRSTKLVDPFLMLAQAGGAAFQDFWNEHLGSESILSPFHAFRSQRWALLWTSVLFAAAQLLTPFASELTATFFSNYRFKTGHTSGIVQGHAFWINPPIVRVLQGLLAFIFPQFLTFGSCFVDTNPGWRQVLPASQLLPRSSATPEPPRTSR